MYFILAPPRMDVMEGISRLWSVNTQTEEGSPDAREWVKKLI